MSDSVFNHFDAAGNAVMVDVSAKETGLRTASAAGSITMSAETLRAIQEGTARKGDVLGVARLGGIMAAKKTPELIPLCHPLGFDSCVVDFFIDEAQRRVEARCTVKLSGKTGA